MVRTSLRPGVDAARELRHSRRATPAEQLLWEAVRDRRLDGLKFRRQHPIGPFVVDFCCASCRLVVELDGEVHDDPECAAQDKVRAALLEAHGYRLLRFHNKEILFGLPAVLESIAREASEGEIATLPATSESGT